MLELNHFLLSHDPALDLQFYFENQQHFLSVQHTLPALFPDCDSPALMKCLNRIVLVADLYLSDPTTLSKCLSVWSGADLLVGPCSLPLTLLINSGPARRMYM